ncbi:hypothetical protein P9112_012527 [Eukaryota sp. TZLM1-RC]
MSFTTSPRRVRRVAVIDDASNSSPSDRQVPLSARTFSTTFSGSDSVSIPDASVRLNDSASEPGSPPPQPPITTPLTAPYLNEDEDLSRNSSSALLQKVSALRRMFQAERSARSSLEEELKSVRAQYRTLEKTLSEKDEVCVRLFREKDLLAEKLITLQTERAAELETDQSDYHSTALPVKNKKKQAGVEHARLSNDLRRLEQKNEDLQDSLDTTSSMLDAARAQARIMEEKVRQLSDALDVKEEALDQSEKEKKSLRDRYRRLQLELSACLEERNDQDQTVEKLQEEVKLALEGQEEQKQKVIEVEGQVGSLSQSLKQKQKQNQLLADRLLDLTLKTQRYRLEIRNFRVVRVSKLGSSNAVINICKSPRTGDVMLEVSFGSTLKVTPLMQLCGFSLQSDTTFKIEFSKGYYEIFESTEAPEIIEILNEFTRSCAEAESSKVTEVADQFLAFLGL